MAKYPTKEQILEIEQKFKPETIKIVKGWKKIIWKLQIDKKSKKEKYKALRCLALTLADAYKKPVKIQYEPDIQSCCYQPATKTIFINSSTSIISLMHEFAHHLYGSSELKACKWSVWLFKKTFPISYKKLKWKGHMLIK